MAAEIESLTRGAPVEARSEEWRKMEPAAEGEPDPDAMTSVDEIELRSLLAVSLRPSAFPGNRAQLLEIAREEYAEQRVLAWLESLPGDQEFATVQSVWEALGGAFETRETPYVLPVPHPTEHIPAQIEGSGVSSDASSADANERNPGATDHADAAAPAGLTARLVRVAFAGVSLVVGVASEAVRVVRRRL